MVTWDYFLIDIDKASHLNELRLTSGKQLLMGYLSNWIYPDGRTPGRCEGTRPGYLPEFHLDKENHIIYQLMFHDNYYCLQIIDLTNLHFDWCLIAFTLWKCCLQNASYFSLFKPPIQKNTFEYYICKMLDHFLQALIHLYISQVSYFDLNYTEVYS